MQKSLATYLRNKFTGNRFLKRFKRWILLPREIESKITAAMARAAATASIRNLDATDWRTWEFAGFSQHGEDGIIDFLCSRITTPNRFFFEIGSANGLENCTTWLALARSYGGVMVEGNFELANECRTMIEGRVWNVCVVSLIVNAENVATLMKMCPYKNPDVFVIDIDGIDYYALKGILKLDYRPKIIVVEYNSAFGPERSVTVPYRPEFSRWELHPSGLLYGVSITAWRKLLNQYGYKFLTVESSGTNAFFLDPEAFPNEFVEPLRGSDFRDNLVDRNSSTLPYKDANGSLVLPRRDWRSQMELIKVVELVEV
jgi:hypothetical protein